MSQFLTFYHFSRVNRARSDRWHMTGIESWSASDWMTAAVGELGEAANVVKKMNRIRDGLIGNKGEDQERATLLAKLADEIADTVIYLDLLAQSQGIDLAEAIVKKFNEVSERHGFDERLMPR